MSWNFEVDKQASVRGLIQLATKYEQDIDMDTVREQSKKDAQLYITNPENQKSIVEIFDRAITAEGTSGFSEFASALDEASKAQKAKSMPHLQPIFDKYLEARPTFEKIYDEIFRETLHSEAREKWLKTRPPEFWVKKDEVPAEGLEKAKGLAPVLPPLK